jgi:predicted nucleic-acid-binding Zn-ribbon protein
VWKCPNCAEGLDDTYHLCWHCGSNPEGAVDPDFKRSLLERDHSAEEAEMLSTFKCAKCGHQGAEVETVRAAAGLFSKLLHIESARFEAVTCSRCRYTEFYKADRSALRDIFAAFGG